MPWKAVAACPRLVMRDTSGDVQDTPSPDGRRDGGDAKGGPGRDARPARSRSRAYDRVLNCARVRVAYAFAAAREGLKRGASVTRGDGSKMTCLDRS